MANTRRLKRSVIKEELVALTGNYIDAILLNQFIYWSERVEDFDDFVREEKARAEQNGYEVKIDLMDGWIYKKAEELSEETMLGLSNSNIMRHIKSLVEAGWLEQRRNPKNKMDKTYQYRVNISKIQTDLIRMGYTLEGYRIPLDFIVESQDDFRNSKIENRNSKIESRDSKTEIRSSNLELRSSKTCNRSSKTEEQYQRIHTEITSETTSEITNNNNKTVVADAQTERVRNEIEAKLRLNIKTLVPLLKGWIDQYGEEDLLKKADFIASREWDNPIGAFRSAVEQDWPIDETPDDVSSVDSSVIAGKQRDKRYAAFYNMFPDA
jgi:DNA-binding MarR family transcriptional regulator